MEEEVAHLPGDFPQETWSVTKDRSLALEHIVDRFVELNTWFDLEWYWYVRIAPISLRILAIFAAMMSLLVVWCEVTFFSDTPVLSVINLLIHSDMNTFGTYV